MLSILLVATVSANGTTVVNVGYEAEQDVDLHALCEDLAEQCWDLQPEDFGMKPVNDMVPAVEGSLASVEWDEGVHLGAELLGEKVKVHVDVDVSLGASHSTEDNTPEDQVPCADPECPDLTVDPSYFVTTPLLDVRSFTEESCSVVEGSTQPGTRRLLRFTFTTPNIGQGDLEVGAPVDHPEWFEWGSCHNHWHFREYADYRLWDVAGYAAWQAIRAAHPGVPAEELLEAYPILLEHMVSGHKQGFCVIDIFIYGSASLFPKQFESCHTAQGISRQWADSYSRFLDGQWVDVTDLPAGPYVLEAEVNPERQFIESDYTNNAVAFVVRI